MESSTRFIETETFLKQLQTEISSELEGLDVVKFLTDAWTHDWGGGGITKVLENGLIFEKAAVNFSSVRGTLSEALSKQLNTEMQDYNVTGLSIIVHPESPKVPTIHMNLRYFELESGKCWFGGGTDLTPYYPYPEDFKYFHHTLKDASDSIIQDSYSSYKLECDRYFSIPHRNEMRGVGGIFFDYLDGHKKKHLDLIKAIGKSFLKSYVPIVKLRSSETYSDIDKKFQLMRRGRYIEFNLLYDKGTMFGLRSNGRVESILASLPPKVHFYYNRIPDPGSPQEEMLKYYQPTDWINT